MQKRLSDPSSIESYAMPRDIDQLIQIMDHNAVIVFDNVSYVNGEQSDALCRGSTGEGTGKRKLWTDDDDIVRKYRRKILVNGTCNPLTKTDAIDRLAKFDTRKIRKTRTEEKV